jgi:hypothetical protein
MVSFRDTGYGQFNDETTPGSFGIVSKVASEGPHESAGKKQPQPRGVRTFL